GHGRGPGSRKSFLARSLPSNRSLGRAQFRRLRAGIGPLFGRRGADDLPRHARVQAGARTLLEGLFHTAVLAGMKRDQGGAPARTQAAWQLAQERFERAKLVVDLDADGLDRK